MFPQIQRTLLSRCLKPHSSKLSKLASRPQSAAAASASAAAEAAAIADNVGPRSQPFYEVQREDPSLLKLFKHSEDSDPIIKPKFWYGDETDAQNINLFQQYTASQPKPETYTIDCSKYINDASGKISSDNIDLIDEMRSKYKARGLVYLQNTGLTDLAEMREIMEILIPSEQLSAYEGGSNWRNYIDSNVYDTGAPYNSWIHYHHEMAYVQYSPLLLGFACKYGTETNPRKGATFVSNGELTTQALLETDLGKKLRDVGICYHRDLTDRSWFLTHKLDEMEVYNHWQQSFNCETMEEATYNAEQRGLRVNWELNHPKWGNYMKTKFYIDTYEYCKDIDKNVLYASVADHHMWFDSWPGVSKLAPLERPLEITYGNDEKFTYEELKTFVDVYDRYGIPIDWKTGEIAIMCNFRWAHGRPAFYLDNSINEQRELGVVLGPMYKRQGQREGKW